MEIYLYLPQLPLFLSTVSPQIIDAPDNITVVQAEDASFSCLATGRPIPEIVWIRLTDMAQLQSQLGLIVEEQEAGDTQRRSNLTIIGVQLADSGAYVCVATNELGSLMAHATITVHGILQVDIRVTSLCSMVDMQLRIIAVVAILHFCPMKKPYTPSRRKNKYCKE